MSDERNGVSYSVQSGRKGWNVVRYNYQTGERRVVATAHSEYAAQVKMLRLQGLTK